MSSKHIAASGKRAGQWVTCLAPKGECPLGGHHVDEMELKKVQEWAGRRAFVDLNADDYKDYLKSKIAGTLEQDKRELETLEEKRARLGKESLTKKPVKKRIVSAPSYIDSVPYVSDYVAPGAGSSQERQLLSELKNFKAPRGPFGLVTAKAVLLEKMVQNQIVFRGSSTEYKLEKLDLKKYGLNTEHKIERTKNNITQIARDLSANGTPRVLKRMNSRLDKFIEVRDREALAEQSHHDAFVQKAKEELLRNILNKGYRNNSDYALKVASATRASEIYELKDTIDKLGRNN